MGYFIVRCPVDVIEDRTGQPSPGQFPEIMEGATVSQAHIVVPASISSRKSRRRRNWLEEARQQCLLASLRLHHVDIHPQA
jgi:hypothetical protein